MQTFSKLVHSALLLVLLFSLSANSKAQSEIHVDRNGSAAPDGTAAKPYQLIKAGACRVPQNGTIAMRPGIYNETPNLNRPVKLTASGPAVIGQVAGKGHATLKVITYNTHLFGDEAVGFPPTFADATRAALIAEFIKIENADVVALQEVWDEELASRIVQIAGYPHAFYSNEHDEWDDFLNSGLLLLSKYPLVNASQMFYRAEDGLDGYASKGFVQATVIEDGFQLGIFSTHTQAEHDGDAVKARRMQLEQLGSQIRRYRSENPGAEVIAMGDFNVISESGEYNDRLLPFLGLRDAYRNLEPCLDTIKHRATCNFHTNDLARLFDNTKFDCDNKRLDYVLYSHGNAFDVLPGKLVVKRYQAAINSDGKSATDLSDHYGIAAEFLLWRNN